MSFLTEISPDTLAFPWAKRTPRRGLLSTVAVCLALVLGRVSGHSSAGAIAAGSAFTVGFAVFHEAMASTLLSMAVLTAGIASATLAGSLGASRTSVVLALAVLAAINYGVLSGLSNTTGWIGQQCAVFVIIASGFSLGRHYAVGRASMVLLGGAMQMVVYAADSAFVHRGTVRPDHLRQLRTRAQQLWNGFHQTLRSDRDTLGYIVRLSLALVLSTLLERHRHLGNGYWAPMTALLVLKPQWTETLSRGVARLTGTLAGAGLGLLISRMHPIAGFPLFAAVLVFAWACYLLQAVNYAAFTFCLTLYTIFSFRLGGFSQPAAAHLRLLNTAVGGGLALAVDFAWKYLPARAPRTDFVQ